MKSSYKKLFSIFLAASLLILSACGSGGNDNGPSPEKMKKYETNYIEASYPQDWELIEQKDFPAGTPDSTIVIFKSNVKNELFVANVNFSHAELSQSISSADYGKQVIANQKAALQNYKELNRSEFEISVDGQPNKALIVAFEGKRIATDPAIRFIQLYAVSDIHAYIATAAMLPTESQAIQLSAEDVVKSLKIK